MIPPVNRNKSGMRSYTEEDCKWVEFIKCMRHSAGLPVEMLIEYVTLFQLGDESLQTRKNLLAEQREKLAERIEEMTNTLLRLDDKIARYDETILKKEQELRSLAKQE